MDKTELLKKLRALALRGIGGEKENAAALLNRLMEKYNITEQELDDEIANTEKFKFHGKIQQKILHQTIYKVTGFGEVKTYKYSGSGRACRTLLGAECTKAQKIEIEFLFDFYTQLWERDQKAFLNAFIQKHKIFGECKDGEGEKISKEEYMKMCALMEGMSDETPVKRLEAGS